MSKGEWVIFVGLVLQFLSFGSAGLWVFINLFSDVKVLKALLNEHLHEHKEGGKV